MTRLYVVQTSYTDGWRCERHHIAASSVEEACVTAIEAAGMAHESWVSCEPGEAIIDDVIELADCQWIPRAIPTELRGSTSFDKDFAERDALRTVLTEILKQVGDQISPATFSHAVALLS